MIQVRISTLDYPLDRPLTPALWESWLVDKLRAAGVPIKGLLVYDGLTHGTLSRYDDPCDFSMAVYEWRA